MINRRLAFSFAVSIVLLPSSAAPASAAGRWQWPVTGPILRGYDPPDSPYSSGHRGIDIGAPVGTAVRAPEAGKVTFAGKVGGHLFLTIDHGAGVSSTYSWLTSIAVKKGAVVVRGDIVARSGAGHPGDVEPSLHFGVKLNGAYVDPLDYLGTIDISDFIRLAPLGTQSAPLAAGTSSTWSGGHLSRLA
jgi:murein DD-endopeptidase MepM/ murein hydrolase activator NlpD